MRLLFLPTYERDLQRCAHSPLSEHIRVDLLGRLADIKRKDYPAFLWIGGKAPDFLSANALSWPVEGAEERFPYPPDSLDLIVVNGCLNRVNDLPGVLAQIRRALKPDGLFLCGFTGGETLRELRESLMRVEIARFGGASPRIHPMIDLQTMAGLMQRAGFALPVIDNDLKAIRYRKFKSLLKDIKQSGEGLCLTQKPRNYLGRTFWPAVADDYARHHADQDGLLRMSVDILYAIGWGPAETQQKPLKPGSAEHRLSDALR